MFRSEPSRELHEQFVREIFERLLKTAVFEGIEASQPVTRWKEPEELSDILDLRLPEKPKSVEDIKDFLEKVVHYSVKTGHRHFVNQLFSSLDPFGLIGQWVTDALNPSVYTYEVAPVFTLLELELLREMRSIVGWDGGDGVFCPGGSVANFYGISCARYKWSPGIKEEGLSGRKLVLFTSVDAHYSVKKGTVLLGIGSNNLVLVNTDDSGRMNVVDLEDKIQQALKANCEPFAVVATAGTTVLGAFDPLNPIADVCEKYGMWLHVDAAWGGGALMSRKYRHLLTGIERADSITWNPHKLLAAPQQCSVFLTKHTTILKDSNSASATYLFQKDKFYDTKWDVGDKYLQCGRKADVLKFWTMWIAKGKDGFERHVDKLFEITSTTIDQIKARPDKFKLVMGNQEFVNTCFWFIPKSLRGKETMPGYEESLHKVAPRIKERMIKEGTMLVTYQPLGLKPNFFRLVYQNSALETEDVRFFLDEIERLGEDL